MLNTEDDCAHFREKVSKFIIRDSEIMQLPEVGSDNPMNIRRLGEVGRVNLVIMKAILPDGTITELHGYFLGGLEGDLSDYHLPLPPRLLAPAGGDQTYMDLDDDQASDCTVDC
jgi:hypothetical protein